MNKLNLVTAYFDTVFAAVFGCKIGSHQGLLILSALSMLSSVLSLLCLRAAVRAGREKSEDRNE